MKFIKRSVYFGILIFLFILLCSTSGWAKMRLPVSEKPVKIKEVFYASFDKVWEGILEVLKFFKGTIIVKDKSSGIITYKLSPQKFINIYIKKTKSYVNCFIVPYDLETRFATRYPDPKTKLNFYEILIHKNYMDSTYEIIFEKLMCKINKSKKKNDKENN